MERRERKKSALWAGSGEYSAGISVCFEIGFFLLSKAPFEQTATQCPHPIQKAAAAGRICGLPSRSSESRLKGQTSTQIPSRLHFSLSTFIRLISELIQLRLEVRLTRRRLYRSQPGLGIVCFPGNFSRRLLAFQLRSGARSRNFVGKSRIDRPLIARSGNRPRRPIYLGENNAVRYLECFNGLVFQVLFHEIDPDRTGRMPAGLSLSK